MPRYSWARWQIVGQKFVSKRGPGKLRSFWEHEVAEAIQRHENDVTYTIKTISQPEKVRTLQRNMLMPVNHILRTVDDAPNICLMK